MVHARTERIGSWDINKALIDHVRRHRGLVIGEQTAERLKLELASATLPADLGQQITIKGRDILTSSPGAIEITAGEVYPVANEVVRKIVDIISETLAELPAEVAADIYDRGIILTGGGALLSGLDDYVKGQTRLSTRIADEPRYAIVRGLEQMFAEPLWLRRVMRCRSDQFLNFERDVSALET
jgi:rod shape-determining protein MreB